MPVAAVRIEADDFSFRIDAVDVAAVCRRERSELRLRRFTYIGLSKVDATGESLGVDVGDRAPVGIESQHPLERRRLVDRPDHRIKFRIDIHATGSPSAWYAEEELIGSVSLWYLYVGAVRRCPVVRTGCTEQRQQ